MISVKEAKEISLMKWEGELNDSNTYKSEIDVLYPEAKNHYFCGFCLRHGYAQLTISNTEILKKLRRQIESYNIPIMRRKWEVINYEYESRLVGSNLLKEVVLQDLSIGLSVTEIAKKYNASYSNIYRIKKEYYDK